MTTGFNLIEILVVLAIALTAALYPAHIAMSTYRQLAIRADVELTRAVLVHAHTRALQQQCESMRCPARQVAQVSSTGVDLLLDTGSRNKQSASDHFPYLGHHTVSGDREMVFTAEGRQATTTTHIQDIYGNWTITVTGTGLISSERIDNR